MICRIRGLVILFLITGTTSCCTCSPLSTTPEAADKLLEGAQLVEESAPRLQPQREQETSTKKEGSGDASRCTIRNRGHDAEQRSAASTGDEAQQLSRQASDHLLNLRDGAMKPPERAVRCARKGVALHRTKGRGEAGSSAKPEKTMRPAGSRRDDDRGKSISRAIRSGRRASKRRVGLMERRRARYRVDSKRAFHADYAAAHPHPPRNN